MKCIKCGIENPDDALYCHACGASLAAPKVEIKSPPKPVEPKKKPGGAVFATIVIIAIIIGILIYSNSRSPSPSYIERDSSEITSDNSNSEDNTNKDEPAVSQEETSTNNNYDENNVEETTSNSESGSEDVSEFLVNWNMGSIHYAGVMTLFGNSGYIEVQLIDRYSGQRIYNVIEKLTITKRSDGTIINCYDPVTDNGAGYSPDNFFIGNDGSIVIQDNQGYWSREISIREK